jgi:nucleoside-diphosphate-sugar epimerase
MKIIVAGITGFIGSHLYQKLLKEKHNIFAIIRSNKVKEELEQKGIVCFVDINNSMNELLNFFSEVKADGVVHLASHFSVEHKSQDINDLIDSNVLFSTRILEAAIKSQVKWFINTGTFWQHYQNKRYLPVNLYAATKQAFEDIAKFYLDTSGINFVTLKLNDTYGPADKRKKILNVWMNCIQTGEALDMSEGEQLIDITYIDDVVDAYVTMIKLLENDTSSSLKGKFFAVSSSKPLKLKELAKIFERISSGKLNINWGAKPYRSREVMIPWNQGKSIPGWKPRVSLEEGIKRFINSYKEIL